MLHKLAQAAHGERYLIVASSTAAVPGTAAGDATDARVPGTPLVASTTIHLVRCCLSDSPLHSQGDGGTVQSGHEHDCMDCDIGVMHPHRMCRACYVWANTQCNVLAASYVSHACEHRARWAAQVRLADGRQLDQYTITDDFVHLSHNSGVYLYEDLLALLAVRRRRMQ